MHLCMGLILTPEQSLRSVLEPYIKYNREDELFDKYKVFVSEDARLRKLWQRVRDKYPDFDSFVQAEYSHYEKNCETGEYGSWGNPNGIMDYYYLGNKWPGVIRLKTGASRIEASDDLLEGLKASQYVEIMLGGYQVCKTDGRADMAYIRDIDFSADPATAATFGPVWDTIVDGAELTERMKHETPWVHHDSRSARKLVKYFGTKERFIAFQSPYPYSTVLTPDGVFHDFDESEEIECQDMLFDYSKNGLFTEILKDYLKPDYILATIDYHV